MNRRNFLACAAVASVGATISTAALAHSVNADPVIALYDEWVAAYAASLEPGITDDDFLQRCEIADAAERRMWGTPAITQQGLLCKAKAAEKLARQSIPGGEAMAETDLDWDVRCVVMLRAEIQRMAGA